MPLSNSYRACNGSGIMTIDQTLSFAIIFGMMGLFAWGKLRYDLVALLALLAALAIGIVPADKAFDGFRTRAAFRHVRLHAGRRWLGAGRRGLSCLRLAALAA